MSVSQPRPLPAIDAALEARASILVDIQGELAEVRRRRAELVELEGSLLIAAAAQTRRIDRLLDERLRVALAVDEPLQDAGRPVGTP